MLTGAVNIAVFAAFRFRIGRSRARIEDSREFAGCAAGDGRQDRGKSGKMGGKNGKVGGKNGKVGGKNGNDGNMGGKDGEGDGRRRRRDARASAAGQQGWRMRCGCRGFMGVHQ
jgi:hypothetical protein